jgi:hypothetical protein
MSELDATTIAIFAAAYFLSGVCVVAAVVAHAVGGGAKQMALVKLYSAFLFWPLAALFMLLVVGVEIGVRLGKRAAGKRD